MSNAKEIGTRVVGMIREGKHAECIQELYADDCVSVEAMEGGGMPREMTGREAILGKNQWWTDNMEVQEASVDGPFPHGEDRFATVAKMTVKDRNSGNQMNMHEVGVYTVANGKIVREEFYYDM